MTRGVGRIERGTEPKANKQLKVPTLVFLLQLKLRVITIIVIVIQYSDYIQLNQTYLSLFPP